MKIVTLVLAVMLTGGFALAAEAPPPAPVEKTIPVALTAQEIQAVAASLANSGAACDQNVAIYCVLAQLRGPILAKMTAALQQPAAAPTPAAKDEKKK